ncbi:MAG: CPBP family intramembrane glutamic endopeptidase [Clostridiaceae bacterium]|nr:CPBP family intramembrane glutamic endopeptidase [Clostridiaceae bacterium]
MQLKPSALAGWALFLLLLFLSVFYALAQLGTTMSSSAASYLVLGGAELLIFGVPTVFLKKYRPLVGLVSLRGRPPRKAFAMNVLFASIALALLSFLLNCLCLLPQGKAPAGLAEYYPIRAAIPSNMTWIVIAALIVVPAIVQELFLRGAIFSLYEKRGTATALLLTACAYAMLQKSPEIVLSALAAGLGYALLTYCTGSIWAPIFAHMLNNGYAMFISWLSVKYPYNVSWEYFIAGNVVLLFICAYIAVRTLRNLVREEQVPRMDPGPGTVRINLSGAAATTGFLLFAALFLTRIAITIIARFA